MIFDWWLHHQSCLFFLTIIFHNLFFITNLISWILFSEFFLINLSLKTRYSFTNITNFKSKIHDSFFDFSNTLNLFMGVICSISHHIFYYYCYLSISFHFKFLIFVEISFTFDLIFTWRFTYSIHFKKFVRGFTFSQYFFFICPPFIDIYK